MANLSPKFDVAFAKSNGTIVGNKQGHGLVTGDVVYISAEKEFMSGRRSPLPLTPQYHSSKCAIQV